MHAFSTPLALVSLVRAGYVSLHFVAESHSLQIWFHPPTQPTLAETALAAATLRLARWIAHAHAGARVAPVAASYPKPWVFETIRRTVTDTDKRHYAPFLERVCQTTALNVSLRPYQQRAVAWMLTRELCPPPSQRFLVWQLAEQLSDDRFFCESTAHKRITVEPHVVFDLFEGAICLGPSNDPRERLPTRGTGGLLCDEMGLGKTVELMQLVLCNKRDASEVRVNRRVTAAERHVCSYCEHDTDTDARETRAPQCVDCGRSAHKACITHGHLAPGGYVCPICIRRMYSISKQDVPREQIPNSKATLIVIPSALLLQWKTEIEKHVRDALNIIVFQGLRASGYIPQRVLQNADVVLTTYEALRADVNFVNCIRKPRTSRRYERKYFPLPVPLLGVHWHRIALDESQMLGAGANSFSQVAEMASFLRATHKWCVTGTPMSTDLHDVVPMFRLLRLEDSEEDMSWSSLFAPSVYEEDQNRVSRILRSVMWRTRHYDVQVTELNIPRRHFEVIHTLLGPVEKYHYNMLQEYVQQVVQSQRTGAASNVLLQMLRQACCHPRIGASGRKLVVKANGGKRLRDETSVQKAERRAESPLELGEVLQSLLMKCQVDCEEEFRNLVASMNGQAGMSLLIFSTRAARNRNVVHLVMAVDLYRNVLRLAEYNKDILKMDDIQVMHVKFNLNDALQSVKSFRQDLRRLKNPSSADSEALETLNRVGESLRDANLSKDVNDLKEKYVAEAQLNLQIALATYEAKFSKLGRTPLIPDETSQTPDDREPASDGESAEEEESPNDHVSEAGAANQGEERQRKQRSMKVQWWEIALAVLIEEDKGPAFVDKMVQRLTEPLAGDATEIKTLATRLHSIHALARVITEGLKGIQEARLVFRKKLLELPGAREPTEEDIAESGLCSACRDQGTGPICGHCRSENLITDVERKVYSLRERLEEYEMEFTSDHTDRERMSEGIDADAVVKGTFRSRANTSRFESNSSKIFYQGELEVILLALASVVRKKKDKSLTEEVNDWFARLGHLKEEHNDAKVMFEAQRSLLARLDEVKMAQMRMSVLDPQIDPAHLTELELRHRIPRHRLEHMLQEFKSDKRVAELAFQNTRGRLVYLRSLSKGFDTTNSGNHRNNDVDNFKSCPICLGSSDSFSSLAMFPCGHLFCCECALGMITNKNLRSRANSLLCPQCRTRCLVDEINFTSNSQPPARKRRRVDSGSTDQEEDIEIQSLEKTEKNESLGVAGKKPEMDNGHVEKPSSFYSSEIEVLGQFGAKTTAIVRLLRSIWNENDEEKILIFSEWSEVLNLVRKALERNNIPFCDGDQSKSSVAFAKTVDIFKSSEIRNVILLPLRRAGAGLNLTEARHVVLVEPSLQVALEAQAVGRVHRIGQTKETYVHRVIVRCTIEEMIFQLGNKYREDRNTSEEAIVDLKDVIQSLNNLPLSMRLQGQGNTGGPTPSLLN
ncbi:Helicase [Gracilaria domingensis]|nr:Helicase [Gracilaria domingensis]